MTFQQLTGFVGNRYKNWPYKNTALLVLSLLIFFYINRLPEFQGLMRNIGSLGYLGAVVAGMFFVSIFTVVPSLAVIYSLADVLNPWEVALFAGLGAIIGDYLIFRFLRDRVFEEVKPLALRFGGSYLVALFRTPYFSWLIPFIGAIIVASPLPDEVGIGLMSASKLRASQFLFITFLLNATGILVMVLIAKTT